MEPALAIARPRIGLLGNPSDGFGGRVLATTFEDFQARVDITPGERNGTPEDSARVLPPLGSDELEGALRAGRLAGGVALLAAARLELEAWSRERGIPLSPRVPRHRLRFESDIPRQVGLAGSSAIVVAALRALARFHGLALSPDELARLALRAERDRLGIAAGPQDRTVQAHEGLLAMDFAREGEPRVERLDSELLPELFLAWSLEPGRCSGVAHGELRARFERGDASVRGVLADFAALADAGRAALLAHDHATLERLFRESLALRRRLFRLADDDLAKIAIAEREGAAAKLPGSGGALVGIARDEHHAGRLGVRFRSAGFGFVLARPTSVRSAPATERGP